MAAGLSGCLSPLHKQSVALLGATTPVVEQASAAYHGANELYDTAVDFRAVRSFERPEPVYNPRTTDVLLPGRDIQIRLKVLQAFQLYVGTVVEITDGVHSAALDDAAKSVGTDLSGISNDVAPAVENTLKLTGSAAPVTPTARNGISTAANALGQFLVYRTVKRQLPALIIKMDPQVKVLCELLEADITGLQDQQKRDYDTIIDSQRQFIIDSTTLNPEDRRNEIMKLPGIVRKERMSEAQLASLKASVVKLYLTHHALAAEAQGNSPESLKNKLSDLESAGSSLGTFYSSLPTN